LRRLLVAKKSGSHRDTSPIRVAILNNASAEEPADSSTGQGSPYLYIAGLLVTLSGLYAATYDMTDSAFGNILKLLAVTGYAVSYWLRRSGFNWKQYQLMVLALFGLAVYFIATSAPAIGASGGAIDMRPYQAQTVVVWIAVLQSFTLANDNAILFACVPAMALLGIMSSGTPDDEVQYAFLVFLASCTFMMVHENHLRSRSTPSEDVRGGGRFVRSLLQGEVVIAVACVLATMVLARGVGPVLQVVGKAVLPSTPIDAFRDKNSKNPGKKSVRVTEDPSVEIATGPRTAGDTVLLQVNSNVPISYLRGSSYDFYTGHSFEDRMPEPAIISPGPIEGQSTDGNVQQLNMNAFKIPDSALDPSTVEIESGTACRQVITVRDAVLTHFYAAPSARQLLTAYTSVLQSSTGGLSIETSMNREAIYIVNSRLPCQDPDKLRRASGPIPGVILSPYTQLPASKSERVQQFVSKTISAATNEYDRVVALKEAVGSTCAYTLQAAAIPKDRDVVDAFLFESRQGYCDSFAAALTVVCRYAGIPARMASGFLSGEQQGEGRYLVRERHKHVWTEVYFPQYGWVPFDATEGAQEIKSTVAGTTTARSEGWRWLFSHGPVPPIILCTILILAGYLIKTELLPRLGLTPTRVGGYASLAPANAQIAANYRSACEVLASRGYQRYSYETPTEYLNRLQSIPAAQGAGEALNRLTALHSRYVYGSAMPSSTDVEASKLALSNIRVESRKLRRPEPV
jgi:Transglutaminase-like superfamily/Domain of unknown function (DUF4129)